MTAPAFQFYAQDFLTGVMYLTNEEIGIYIKMLAKQWTDGKIPKKRLGFLVGIEWDDFSEELQSKFTDFGEYIINERLENERKKKENFIEKQSKNGKKGGRPTKNESKETPIKTGKKTQIKANHLNNENPNKSQKKPLEIEDEDEIEEENENILKKSEKTFDEIINHLNEFADRQFRLTDTNRKHIRARIDEGWEADQLKKIIEIKTLEWKGNPDMEKHLNPETLFRPSNIEKYWNQVLDAEKNPSKYQKHFSNGNQTRNHEEQSVDDVFNAIYGEQ